VTGLLVFASALMLAVLVSGVARRTVLSTAVLFLVTGFLVGDGMLGLVSVTPGGDTVRWFAEAALFGVLLTDGMKVGIRDLAGAWHLPGRALLLGLPLTLALTALLARIIVGLPWGEALLVGAALSATDPVLSAAIVGREEVPARLRRLLNVESGLNDGLALPVVVVLLAILGQERPDGLRLLGEVGAGVLVGVAIPWAALRLEQTRYFGAAPKYRPLTPVALALLVFAVATIEHVNLFLAAFAAGVTIETVSPETVQAFHELGESVTELLKLAALLLFGALISPGFLAEIPWQGYGFAALTLLLARPVALTLALVGSSELSWREWLAASWFGPKGFASVVYGLIVLNAGLPRSDELFHLIAIVTAGSIVAHSSTDVAVARWLKGQPVRRRPSASRRDEAA
jgi:NhaP-type Na+/H+ or K+/H+ antiporter